MSKPSWVNSKFFLIGIWILGIGIRLYGATRPAQVYDIATFEAWSRSIWIYGVKNFFDSVWSDYLPLPILTFAPVSLLSDTLSLNFGFIFKIIHIAVELVLIYFIARLSPLKQTHILALLLLSPALIADTAFWGQVDTIPALLALASMRSLLYFNPSLSRSKYMFLLSGILFGIAVAYKPIMILVSPVLWIISIKNGYKYWQFPLISSLVFLLSGVPTGGINFFTHLLLRTLNQSDTYPFLTVNAFNMWSLKSVNNWISDSTTILGISGKFIGLSIFSLSLIKVLWDWYRDKFNLNYSHKVAAIILIMFFTFTTRMHERHLLFGLPFLALATVYDIWLLIPFIILTITFTLNLYGAFYWVDHNQMWPFSSLTISLISLATTLTTAFLVALRSWPNFIASLSKVIKTHKILISILGLAVVLRLGNLSNPSSYIFDEVYHAFTARQYLNHNIDAWEWWTTPPAGVAYEWTHPPVAKYFMELGMIFFGENSFGWRIGSAIFGVLSILGLYKLVLAITKNKQVALISSFLLTIEGTHIAQSRVAMNDIYMLCFYIWSLYLAIKSRWRASAILYGLALASKWSSIYGIIPLIYIYLHEFKFSVRSVLTALRLLLITVFIYVLTFAPFILVGHTWPQWWELHRQMWYYHTHLVATHDYQSTPLQWIFGLRPVWYYVNYLEGSIANIYVQGNPFILWVGLVALIFESRHLLKFKHSIFMILYAIFTFPWIISPRIMFYYHYLPSATFLCVTIALWLSKLKLSYKFFVLGICILGLLIIIPMLYGFLLPSAYWDVFFKIFRSWK